MLHSASGLWFLVAADDHRRADLEQASIRGDNKAPQRGDRVVTDHHHRRHQARTPVSPFIWGVSQRLIGAVAVSAALWLAVAWALDWWG
jgi:hypothetical protein